jgi:putative tricarboxylic transport membrane protein
MKAERIGAIFVVILGVAYLWGVFSMEDVSIGDPLGPRAFPALLGAVMVALGSSLVVKPDRESGSIAAKRALLNVGILAGLLAGYGYSIPWLGYPVATFLFLFLTSRLLGERSWWLGVAVSAAVSGGVFLLFTRVLDIPLPKGILGGVLG